MIKSKVVRVSKELDSLIEKARSNIKETIGIDLPYCKASKVVASAVKDSGSVRVIIGAKHSVKRTVELKL